MHRLGKITKLVRTQDLRTNYHQRQGRIQAGRSDRWQQKTAGTTTPAVCRTVNAMSTSDRSCRPRASFYARNQVCSQRLRLLGSGLDLQHESSAFIQSVAERCSLRIPFFTIRRITVIPERIANPIDGPVFDHIAVCICGGDAASCGCRDGGYGISSGVFRLCWCI